jgi:hypothetical protein
MNARTRCVNWTCWVALGKSEPRQSGKPVHDELAPGRCAVNAPNTSTTNVMPSATRAGAPRLLGRGARSDACDAPRPPARIAHETSTASNVIAIARCVTITSLFPELELHRDGTEDGCREHEHRRKRGGAKYAAGSTHTRCASSEQSDDQNDDDRKRERRREPPMGDLDHEIGPIQRAGTSVPGTSASDRRTPFPTR